MNKNEWKKLLGVVGRMLVAYALVFAQGAWAGQNQGTKDKAASPQKAAQQANEKQPSIATSAKAQSKQAQSEESEGAVAEEKPSREGSHEGIKVHGHWTIEVRNPDGSVATHREFENSLTQSTGAPLLASLLNSGGALPQNQTFTWFVRLSGNACSQNPLPNGTGTCLIQTSAAATAELSPLSPPPVGAQSSNLAPSVNGGSLILSGTVVADTTSQITGVATETASLIGLGTPFGGLQSLSPFTSQTLDGLNGHPQPVSVSAGQTIAVTVNISFS